MQWFFPDFDEEKVKCLFCQEDCDLQSSSSLIHDYYQRNVYTCRKCGEYQTIYVFPAVAIGYEGTDQGKATSHIWDFSCGDFIVALGEKENKLAIGKRGADDHDLVSVPMFEIDLSDKNKLLAKLKTYLLFS